MSIMIREVVTKKDLRTFVYLSAKIHKGHTNWVPPIYMDELSFFDPRKNKSFSFCDHIRLLAFRNGEAVGRIMGLINHRYNERKNENNARFSYFESFDDPEISRALLGAVEEWARKLKADSLVGPLGFSDKEPMGMMVEGFEHPLVLAANGNMPYQAKLVEKSGFQPAVKMVSYLAEIPDDPPAVYQRVVPRIEEKILQEFTLLEFRSRLRLRKFIYPVLNLTNRAFDHLYGSMPYEKREMKDFANRFIWLLNPRFVKVVTTRDGEVIAYLVGMSDIGEGIIKAGGKLVPFGIFKLFRAAKRTDRLTMLLGAIDEPYRGRGLDVFLALKLMESARQCGKRYIDSHLVLETNRKMRAEYERVGGKVYKRYQIYKKEL